ncbi:MAG: MFS transporter [Rhodocyclaceae bacterium]|nr:MFS transporter [Rhodocyclaceae bacterium]
MAALAEDWPVMTLAMQSGDVDTVAKFMRERGLAYPALVDMRGEIAWSLGVRATPAWFVVDRGGAIRFAGVGYTTGWGLRARLVVGAGFRVMSERGYPPARLAWFVWGLGALLYLIGFYQRVAPAVITDRLMTDFAIGAAALGNLSAFYFYSYVAMQIPTGVIADRWGPRRLLTLGAGVAALGTLLFALAPNLWWASAGRLLIGGSVAVASSPCSSWPATGSRRGNSPSPPAWRCSSASSAASSLACRCACWWRPSAGGR